MQHLGAHLQMAADQDVYPPACFAKLIKHLRQHSLQPGERVLQRKQWIDALQFIFRVLTLQFRIIKIKTNRDILESKLPHIISVHGRERQYRLMAMSMQLGRQGHEWLYISHGTDV